MNHINHEILYHEHMLKFIKNLSNYKYDVIWNNVLFLFFYKWNNVLLLSWDLIEIMVCTCCN